VTVNLKVIIGSTRPVRSGVTVAEWFWRLADKHPDFDTELIDLAAVNLPLLDEPEHPRHGRYAREHTKRWSRIVASGDAFVFVVPEYNHGYNAATKNALDFLYAEWRDKPVGFVSYGGRAGGQRSVGMLIEVITALGMRPAINNVSIPQIQRMLTSSGGVFTPGPDEQDSAVALLDELAALAG
jgi:NAD(P)H-dependent FMN reductase